MQSNDNVNLGANPPSTTPNANSITSSYTYNDGGRPLGLCNSAQSSAAVCGGGSNPYSISYGYDGLNRLTSATKPQGVVQYGYDAANRRSSLNFGPNTANLKSVAYTYDGLNRPAATTTWASATALQYSYSGARLSGMTYPNGVAATYTFDGANRLTDLAQTKGGTTLLADHYTLDKTGNRTATSETLNGTSLSYSYTYDELSRLTQDVLPGVTTNYNYDNVGNRTQMTVNSTAVTSYWYNAGDQLKCKSTTGACTSGSPATYCYDANSNVTGETTGGACGSPTTTYNYDARNRMTGWTKGGNSASFGYDGTNTRTSMAYNGTGTSYLQDTAAGLPVVLQETVGASTPSSYFYGLGSTSPLLQTTASGIVAWYHRDGLGSMRVMSDSVGSTLNTATYSAFGTTTAQTGTTPNSHLFAGEQIDPTGLSFNRARYYDPNTGRFTQRDTFFGAASSPQSLNRFAYVQNNPIGATDPSGYYTRSGNCFVDDDGTKVCNGGTSGGSDANGGTQGTCADPNYAHTYPEECGTAQGGGSDSQGGGGNPGEKDPKQQPATTPTPTPTANGGCQQTSTNCFECRLEIWIYAAYHAILVLRNGSNFSDNHFRDDTFVQAYEGNDDLDNNTAHHYIKAYALSNARSTLNNGWYSRSTTVWTPPLDCSKYDSAFRNKAAWITGQGNHRFYYELLTQNSNSVVRTLLQDLGLPYGSPAHLFGWGNHLTDAGRADVVPENPFPG